MMAPLHYSLTGDWNLTWKGTPAAITSIKLIPQSGNFVTGTTFIVYAED